MLPRCALHRETIPTIFSVFLALKRAEGPGICCYSHQGRIPLFSTFDTWRPSSVTWWVVGMCTHTLSASTPSACSLSESSVPARPCLPKPQLGTKVQRGITGWGAQVTPLSSASLGQVDTSPPGGGEWDRRCLMRKGTSVATCQGPHPSLTLGPVQWVWGFPQGPKAWASSLAAAHSRTSVHVHAP